MALPSFEFDAAASLSLDLVRRIQGGDGEAWNELYRRYHDRLLLAVRCRLGAALRARLESEDLLQSVVLGAMGEIERFEPRGPRSLEHFLHVLVSRKIRDRADHFSARKRRGEEPLLEDRLEAGAGTDRLPRYHDEVRYERLEKALATLPEDMRRVVLLRRVDGLSSQETAREMERTDDAVRKLYSRAIARMSAAMEEHRP